MTNPETYRTLFADDHAERYSDEALSQAAGRGYIRAARHLMTITGPDATALRSAAANQGGYLMNIGMGLYSHCVWMAVQDVLAGRPFYERDTDRILRTDATARRLDDQRLYAEAVRDRIA
jgi:hypothetical protein